MANQLTPALTPEQWAEFMNSELDIHDLVCYHEEGTAVIPDGDAHAAAAMLLYQQPFGFTWDDVDELRNQGRSSRPTGASTGSLADRIAALLPPRL